MKDINSMIFWEVWSLRKSISRADAINVVIHALIWFPIKEKTQYEIETEYTNKQEYSTYLSTFREHIIFRRTFSRWKYILNWYTNKKLREKFKPYLKFSIDALKGSLNEKKCSPEGQESDGYSYIFSVKMARSHVKARKKLINLLSYGI